MMIVDDRTIARLKPTFKLVADVLRTGHGRLDDHDRDDIFRCVVVAVDRLLPGELSRIVARVRRALRRSRPRSIVAYFKQAVMNACRDAGVDFRMASQFPLPQPGANIATQPSALPCAIARGAETTS